MIHKKINLSIFFFCFVLFSKAQPTLDTLKQCLQAKPHLFAKLDTRNSFIENSRAKIFGIKAGLNYNSRLYFGIGYNQLYPPADKFDEKIYFKTEKNITDSAVAALKLFYISIHVEYVFYQTKHWQLSMPLQMGIGETYYKYKYLDENKKIEENINFVYEPAISVEYKFLKYFGIGAEVGYRFMIANNRKLNEKFTSPIYAFSLFIYYSEIYKSLFKKAD